MFRVHSLLVALLLGLQPFLVQAQEMPTTPPQNASLTCSSTFTLSDISVFGVAGVTEAVPGETIGFSAGVENGSENLVFADSVVATVFYLGEERVAEVVDRFVVAEELSLPSADINSFTHEWTVPTNARGGSYFVEYSVILTGGQPIAFDVIEPFSIAANNTPVTIAPLSARINDETVTDFNLAPQTNPLVVSATVVNNTTDAKTVPLQWNQYEGVFAVDENRVNTRTELVTVPAESTVTISYTVPTDTMAAQVITATIDDQSTSIIDIPLFAGQEAPRLLAHGLSALPLVANEPVTAFGCVTGITADQEYDLLFSLTDRQGTEIAASRVVDLREAAVASLTVPTGVDYVRLTGTLLVDGVPVAEAVNVYDCKAINPSDCIVVGTQAAPTYFEILLSDPLLWYGGILALLLALLLVLWVHRRHHGAPVDTTIPTNLSAILLGTLVASAAFLLPTSINIVSAQGVDICTETREVEIGASPNCADMGWTPVNVGVMPNQSMLTWRTIQPAGECVTYASFPGMSDIMFERVASLCSGGTLPPLPPIPPVTPPPPPPVIPPVATPVVDLKINGSDDDIAVTDADTLFIEWTASDVASCTLYGAGLPGGNVPLTGSNSVLASVITASSESYILSCGGVNDDVVVTVTNSNSAPNAPTITGPSTGETGTSYTFAFVSTDPDGDQVRYDIDWDIDGVIDVTSVLVDSGNTINGIESWPTAGSYTLRARARDTSGAASGWTTHSITVTDAVVPPPVTPTSTPPTGGPGGPGAGLPNLTVQPGTGRPNGPINLDGSYDSIAVEFVLQFTEVAAPSGATQFRVDLDLDDDGVYETIGQPGMISARDAGDAPFVTLVDDSFTNVSPGTINAIARVDYFVGDPDGVIAETDESDNELPFQFTLNLADPGLVLEANPSLLQAGERSILTWYADNPYTALTCELEGPGITPAEAVNISTVASPNNRQTSPVTAKSVFTLRCSHPLVTQPFVVTTEVETVGTVEEI